MVLVFEDSKFLGNVTPANSEGNLYLFLSFETFFRNLKWDRDWTAMIVVVIVLRWLLFGVIKLHTIIVYGSSKSLVVGLQPHRDPLTETARISSSVKINKSTSKAEENDDQESRNDGRNLIGDLWNINSNV